jgi:hypothetical protein
MRAAAGCRLISIEKDWLWVLVAKRFLWQAASGGQESSHRIRDGVRVRWNDAVKELEKMRGQGVCIDMLVLDGLPKDTLQYLRAAEPCLSPSAVVVADNAGAWRSSLRGCLACAIKWRLAHACAAADRCCAAELIAVVHAVMFALGNYDCTACMPHNMCRHFRGRRDEDLPGVCAQQWPVQEQAGALLPGMEA